MKFQFIFFTLVISSIYATPGKKIKIYEPPKTALFNKSTPLDSEITQPHPWLTGPLLTPSAFIVPVGHYNVETYFFVNNNLAYINNHWHIHSLRETKSSLLFTMSSQIGLNHMMDLIITPQLFFNYEGMVDSWRFGDLLLALEFQLTAENKATGMLPLKLNVSEIFPTGEYQNLRLSKKGTDSSGGGSYSTRVSLVTSYLWQLAHTQFLSGRLSFAYQVFTNVNVHGLNAYGGDPTTVGKVRPGDAWHLLIGLEYSFSKHWALALDIVNVLTCKTSFSGNTIARVGNKNLSYQLSLCPAIEYNLSADTGLIGGIWLTAFGESTFDFLNGVFAINFYL